MALIPIAQKIYISNEMKCLWISMIWRNRNLNVSRGSGKKRKNVKNRKMPLIQKCVDGNEVGRCQNMYREVKHLLSSMVKVRKTNVERVMTIFCE